MGRVPAQCNMPEATIFHLHVCTHVLLAVYICNRYVMGTWFVAVQGHRA